MKEIIEYLRNEATKQKIIQLISDNIHLYRGINTEDKIQNFTGLVYNQFVSECVQINQYVSLSNETLNEINGIYRTLVSNLRLISGLACSLGEIAEIVTVHREKLIQVLKAASVADRNRSLFVPCAEYTPDFQNEVLRLDKTFLQEPIIDIGCGNKQSLVLFLRRNGYSDVYGLDQYASNDCKIIRSNWLEYNFRNETWGCILAHMSFTNHLRRMLSNNESGLNAYIDKYYELLSALRSGGVFIYTPSVKSVEDTLDREKYKVDYYRNLHDRNLDTVYVTKLATVSAREG